MGKYGDVAAAVLRMDKQLRNELLIKDGTPQLHKYWENTYIKKQICRRESGDAFGLKDHIRAMVYLYEDNVTGKLSDERFIKMSHDYELELSNLKAMAEVLREEIKQQEKQKTNVKAFISAVKKYTDMQQLDAAMLREFIDRIEVSHTDKKSKTREITIVYNFIGAFDFGRAKEKAQNTTQKQQRTA